jgi:hypothetical protein
MRFANEDRDAQRARYAARHPGRSAALTRAWKLANPENVLAQKQRAYGRKASIARLLRQWTV